MADSVPSPLFRDAGAVAAYVETLTGELSRLSREHGLPTLAYILDMARLEARNAVMVARAADEAPAQEDRGA